VSSLSFCYRTAYEAGYPQHARNVMHDLGIKFGRSIPQSVGDQYWFFDCEDLPEVLPDYIHKLDFTYDEYIADIRRENEIRKALRAASKKAVAEAKANGTYKPFKPTDVKVFFGGVELKGLAADSMITISERGIEDDSVNYIEGVAK